MSRKIAVRKVGKDASYRKAMYRNLVTDLIGYGKVTTTEARAKKARGLVDGMITLGKRGGLHCRRQALSFIFDEKVTEKVFTELAQRYASRPGGYTRITKIGRRLGDGADIVQLELIK